MSCGEEIKHKFGRSLAKHGRRAPRPCVHQRATPLKFVIFVGRVSFLLFLDLSALFFFRIIASSLSSSPLLLLPLLAPKGLLHSTFASLHFFCNPPLAPPQGILPSVATPVLARSFSSSSQGRVSRSFLCPSPRASSISSTLSSVRFHHSLSLVASAHKQRVHIRRFMDPHPTRSSRYYQASMTSSEPTAYHNSYFSTSSPPYSSRSTMDSQTPFGPSSLPSQLQPPLPPRTNAQYQSQHQQQSQLIDEQIGGRQASPPDGVTPDQATDLEQHCLLFPTYATTHSRSGKY